MKDFKEIAEKCLKGELSGYFLLKNGDKYFSSELKKDTSKGFLYGVYYFTPIMPIKYYNDRGNCCILLGHAEEVSLDTYNIEKFVPDFQYVRDLEISLASIDGADRNFIDNNGNWFNLLKKEEGFYIFEDNCGRILYKTPYQAMKLKTMVKWIMSPKEQKELKIEIPEEYEIDKENSTFEKIVFKKKDDKPRSWEDYRENKDNKFYVTEFVFPTREFCMPFAAYVKLLALRKAWIGDWEPDWGTASKKNKKYGIINEMNDITVCECYYISTPLSFPTEEMAIDFMNTFKDLLESAKGLY